MSTPASGPDQPLGTKPPVVVGGDTAGRHGTGPSTPGAKPAEQPHVPGVVRRTTNGIKRILLVVVGALAALFAVANRQQVEVHWIFGSAVQTPLILAIVVTFIAGAIIGWLVAKLGRRNRAA